MSAAIDPSEAWRRSVRAVARVERCKQSEIKVPRGRSARHRRLVAAYVAVTGCGVAGNSLARAAGLARYGIQKALRSIEDRRDDPQYDSWLARIEQEIGA